MSSQRARSSQKKPKKKRALKKPKKIRALQKPKKGRARAAEKRRKDNGARKKKNPSINKTKRNKKTKKIKTMGNKERGLKGKTKNKSNCSYCAIGHEANKSKIWAFNQMEADHVSAWIKGGPTTAMNCEMLCVPHNRAKGNR